jgi:hypothetical protein
MVGILQRIKKKLQKREKKVNEWLRSLQYYQYERKIREDSNPILHLSLNIRLNFENYGD